MFNKTIRTRLCNLKMNKNSYKQDIDTEDKVSAYVSSKVLRNFYVGDRVWIRNYQKGDKCILGTEIGRTGFVTYQVKSQIGKQHKHVDKLRYKPDDSLDTSVERMKVPVLLMTVMLVQEILRNITKILITH